MKRSGNSPFKQGSIAQVFKNSSKLTLIGMILFWSFISYAAIKHSFREKPNNKLELKSSKDKSQKNLPPSKVAFLDNKKQNQILVSPIDFVKVEEHSKEVERFVTFTIEKLIVEIFNQPMESILEKEPIIEIISVEEINSENQKNLSFEEWDRTVDLTNIEGSDVMVPKFVSNWKPTQCFHNNGSSEDDPWLIRHQESDGHWDTGQHEGAGTHDIDCAATAAALLSFMARGYTDNVGKYKHNIKLGLEWLLSKQFLDGSWSYNNYVNAICTMCLAEAASMGSKIKNLNEKSELAVVFLLGQQNSTGGFDYSWPSNTANMTVTGWCILALKCADTAGIKALEIKEAFLKCNELLDTTEGTNDNTNKTKGLAWYQPGFRGTGNPGGGCQASAMLIRQYCGFPRTAPWLAAAAEGQIQNLPKDYQSLDIHQLYFTSYSLFQQGGKHWSKWRDHTLEIIKEAKCTDDQLRGSWNNNGSSTDVGGRVLNTALILMAYSIWQSRRYIWDLEMD